MLIQYRTDCKRFGPAICPRCICLYHWHVGIYPPKVQQFAAKRVNVGRAAGENARARDASFVCGSFVGFSIAIDAENKIITAARYETNGCGYMAAAADVLCSTVEGRHLGELHGLDEDELRRTVENEIDTVPADRVHCLAACISALRSAFADYRAKQISEFSGEKALICTCFGVTEETIERAISEGSFATVDEVSMQTRGGGGCGSCRMLIQEILDQHEREAAI